MKFTLSHSGQTGIQTTTVYPNMVTITPVKLSYKNVAQFDHVAGLFVQYSLQCQLYQVRCVSHGY